MYGTVYSSSPASTSISILLTVDAPAVTVTSPTHDESGDLSLGPANACMRLWSTKQELSSFQRSSGFNAN